MFDNIGRKIKTVAKLFCWIEIICCVVAGIAIMGSGESAAVAVGIIVALGGSLMSWVGSFVMVGFGELVENSTKIAAIISDINE